MFNIICLIFIAMIVVITFFLFFLFFVRLPYSSSCSFLSLPRCFYAGSSHWLRYLFRCCYHVTFSLHVIVIFVLSWSLYCYWTWLFLINPIFVVSYFLRFPLLLNVFFSFLAFGIQMTKWKEQQTVTTACQWHNGRNNRRNIANQHEYHEGLVITRWRRGTRKQKTRKSPPSHQRWWKIDPSEPVRSVRTSYSIW